MKHLLQYIDYKGFTIHSFEKELGIRGSLDKAIKQNTNIRSDVFSKIIEIFTDINPDWLITGKGEMLRDAQPVATKPENCEQKIQELKKEMAFLIESRERYKEDLHHVAKLLEECKSEKKRSQTIG